MTAERDHSVGATSNGGVDTSLDTTANGEYHGENKFDIRPPNHDASCLPGMPSASPDPPVTLTMGDFLNVFANLLPHEVSFSMKLLAALRNSEKVSSVPVNVEARALYNTLNVLVEGQRSEQVSQALGTLSNLVQHVSRYGGTPHIDLQGVDKKAKPFEDDISVEDPDSPPQYDRGIASRKFVCDDDSISKAKSKAAVRVWELPFLPPPEATQGSKRKKMFIVFDDPDTSVLGRIIAMALMLTIAFSTVSFIMESMPSFKVRPSECAELKASNLPATVKACEPIPDVAFFYAEAVCIAIFSIDYLTRMLTVHSLPAGTGKSKLYCTLKYLREPLNVIDLVAVAPFYFGLVIGGGLGIMRMLRLARIFRLFKAAKHHPGILMFKDVLVMSGQPLLILVFFNVIIAILFASLIYFTEGQSYSVAEEFLPDHPQGVFVRSNWQKDDIEEVSPFRSIPYALWWVLVTMTTVGYGDYYPTTRIGKGIGVCTFYVGIIFLALPISVLGSNFEFVYTRRMAKEGKPKKNAKRMTICKSNARRCLPDGGGVRRSIFFFLEDPGSSRLSKWWSIFVIIVILVSTASFILESMPGFNVVPDVCQPGHITVSNCKPQPQPYFLHLEMVGIAIFTVDYVGRMATVSSVSPEEAGISKDLVGNYLQLKTTGHYAMQYLNMIDFLAIVPFYVEQAGGGGGGAGVLRVLRLVRIFRVLKMPKMRACAEMFIEIVIDALPALLILFFMTILMCVLFASLIVFAEGSWYSVDHFQDLYPDGVYVRPSVDGYDTEPSPFTSIFYASWWFFTTATTVGYGDDVPTTAAGRIVGVMSFYTGIVLLALPITIVNSAFNKYYPLWLKEFGSASEQLGFEKPEPEANFRRIERQFSTVGSAGSLSSATAKASKIHAKSSKVDDVDSEEEEPGNGDGETRGEAWR